MIVALWLLLLQGMLGAFDTFYYHEWRARLPTHYPQAAVELSLHGARNLLYAVLFVVLPNFELHGGWLIVLILLLAAEIGITLADSVERTAFVNPWVGFILVSA